MTGGKAIRGVRLATLVVAVLALGAGRAAAQTPGWTFGRVAVPGTPAPLALGAALYSSLSPPSIAPDGRVYFRGEVVGASTVACSGTCRALFRATPDVDCTFFAQPSRIFPLIEPLILEGEPAPEGVYRVLDDGPSGAAPPVFHTSCYGPPGSQFEAVFELRDAVDVTPSGGLPCGSFYSSPGAGVYGAAYWRALFEAIAFWRSSDQTRTDLVVPGTPTNTRLGGHFENLAKARSVGWETLERRVAVSEANRVAFLAEVAGFDASPACLGTELVCDAAFVVDVPSGAITVAAARNDPLPGGGTIARFCGPPAVAESGVVVFRGVTSPTGNCDPVAGVGQGIYAIVAPFVPGTAVTLADATVALPDGQAGTFTAQTFSDPVVSTSGAVFFRAGTPGAGAGTAALIRSVPPFGPTELVAVARKGPVGSPGAGIFTSFDFTAPTTNSRGEVTFLSGEGIWVASPTPVVLQECTDAIALCRRTILAAAANLVGGEGRAGQMCFRRILKGKNAPIDCWTQDIQVVSQVARLRAGIARRLRGSCSDDVIPLAGACDRNQPTVAGEVDCLINTHEPQVRAIFDALVP